MVWRRFTACFSRIAARRHAALEQLVQALETDIEWIREHTRLGALAGRWNAQGRASGDLLRGYALEEAERLLTQRPPTALSPTNLHQEYIRANRQAARRRGRMVVAAMSAVAIMTSILGVVALFAKWDAERSERMTLLANSGMLTEFAKQNLGSGAPVTAALLMTEALPDTEAKLNRPFYPEAEFVLRASLRKKRERVLLAGSVRIVRASAFSPDGSRVVTAENDGRARVWEAATGRQLLVLEGDNKKGARTAAYSRDGL